MFEGGVISALIMIALELFWLIEETRGNRG